MRTPEEIDRDIKAAFDELDPVQMAIFRQMDSERKMQRLNDLISATRQLAIDAAHTFHPEADEAEIHRRAMLRFMRVSEWKDDSWKIIFGL